MLADSFLEHPDVWATVIAAGEQQVRDSITGCFRLKNDSHGAAAAAAAEERPEAFGACLV